MLITKVCILSFGEEEEEETRVLQSVNKNERTSEEETELMFLQHSGSPRRQPSRLTRSRACYWWLK